MRLPFLFSTHAAGSSSDTSRLEAFSDGIFSVAITLLGFQLVVPVLKEPATNGRLWSAFLAHWPSYLSFVLSFTSILIMWINHHAIFSVMARMDKLVIVTNGALLLLVTVVPFATSFGDGYLRIGAASLAIALYGALFVAANLAYNALWWTILRRDGLLDSRTDRRWVRSYSFGLAIAFPLYLLAALVAFWSLTPFDPIVREK